MTSLYTNFIKYDVYIVLLAKLAVSLTEEDRKHLREVYESLESNVPKSYDDYPTKRKKLAIKIHEIQDLMDKGQWRWWRTWEQWDNVRLPICYCFECHYPVRLQKTVSLSSGKLQKLDCDMCGLNHFNARYD